MRTLAFDGRTGASGDMILGALIATGADPEVLAPVESALCVRYEISELMKNGISATSVDVVLTDNLHGKDDDHDHDEGSHHGENHDSDGHDSDHGPQVHAEGAGPHRSYREVCELVSSMDLDPNVEKRATEIFTILGEAEAEIGRAHV